MKLGSLIPFIENRTRVFQSELPGLPWKCPAKPGNYSSFHVYNFTVIGKRVNITQIIPKDPKRGVKYEKSSAGIMQMVIPLTNGIFANVINITTENDPAGMQVNFQFEMRDRLGDDKF
jgi:hypothetical protein